MPGAGGAYTGYLSIDADCKRDGLDESNNIVGARFALADVSAPDFAVTRLSAAVSAGAGAGAGAVTYSGEICLSGTGPPHDTTVRIWIASAKPPVCSERGADGEARLPMTPGTCAPFTLLPLPGLFSGTHTTRLFVDADCESLERVESNNIRAVTFTIPQAPPPKSER